MPGHACQINRHAGTAVAVAGEAGVGHSVSRLRILISLVSVRCTGQRSAISSSFARCAADNSPASRISRVISAHGRITGWILVCLPPALGVALMAASEEHRRTMFGDPLGIQMIIGAVVLQVIGTLIIRKIVNVEY